MIRTPLSITTAGVTFTALQAAEFGLNVLCDKNGKSGAKIAYGKGAKTLTLGSNARAPFKMEKGEDLTFRGFIDKCAVEVFANNRQDVLIWDDHPTEELGIWFFSTGSDLRVQEVKCWTMKSIYGK